MSHLDEGTLHAWLDGELEGSRARSVESHLEECGKCRERADEARAAADRASSILAGLEPGPAHAPEWEEIRARAGAVGDATRSGTPGAEKSTGSASRPGEPAGPTWYRTALPWAASLVLAFGLGWFLGDPGLAPPGGPESAASGRAAEAPGEPGAEPAPGVAGDSRDDLVASSAVDRSGQGAGETAPDAARRPATPEQRAEAAAPPVSEEEAEAAAPQADAVAAQPDVAAREPGAAGPDTDLPVARKQAATASAEERQQTVGAGEGAMSGAVAEPTPAATPPAEARAREGEGPADRALLPREATAFRADADATGAGWLAIQPAEADAWLGRSALRLPDLELLRAEVSSGSRVGEPFSPGPVVRLLYADAAGQPVVVLQQHEGPAAAGATDAVGYARAGDERTLNVTPEGVRSLRWREDGLLLVLSARLDADALQALADRLR